LIFVDASAFVAIIAAEPDPAELASKLRDGSTVITSAVAVWETAAALCRSHRYTPQLASRTVDDPLEVLSIDMSGSAGPKRSSPGWPMKNSAKAATRPR